MRKTKLILSILVLLFMLSMLPLWLWRQTLRPTHWPTQTWKTASPESLGLSSSRLAEGLLALKARNAPIDSLLLIRNGQIALEACFAPCDCDQVHNLASVTKSVMTTLIAIAADQGKLNLDQPLVSFFPGQEIANLDSRKQSLTLRHLVSMTAGFESQCLAGDQANMNAMQASPNWIQFSLNRPMVMEPGTTFCYDSPAMHLLSTILRQATGQTTQDFARQHLFAPLGITEFIWTTDPQGNALGSGELYLKPHDLAKIGYLWLNNGQWEGKQIVSAKWVKDSVTPQTKTGQDDDYGYGWWVFDGGYAALGRGGQNLRVIPALNAIVVITGSGVDFDDIEETILQPSITAFGLPLLPNPQGLEKLTQTLSYLRQTDPAWVTASLPATAANIFGKVFTLEPNPENLATLALAFNGTAQATLSFQRSDTAETITWQIGLDGIYRINPEGHGLRGRWLDENTFEIEIFNIGKTQMQLAFVKPDSVKITLTSELWFMGIANTP